MPPVPVERLAVGRLAVGPLTAELRALAALTAPPPKRIRCGSGWLTTSPQQKRR